MSDGGFWRGQLTSKVKNHFREGGELYEAGTPSPLKVERVFVRACVCFVFLRGQQHAYLIGEWDAVIQSGLVAHRVGDQRGAGDERSPSTIT